MHSFMVMLLTCSAVMSLIALIYIAVNPLLARRYSEKGRYYVWLIILAGLIIPIRPLWSHALIRVDVPSETASIPYVGGHTGNVLPTIYFPLTIESAPPAHDVQSIQLDWSWAWSWWQIAFVVWLVGLVAFLAFHAANYYSFTKRIKRWSRVVLDEKPNELLQSLRAEMGITRRIGLVLCEGIGSPMMLGFVKPRILLPATDLAQDELRFILHHELVHYKRRDLLYKCLVLIATAIHWFNPMMYVIAKAINAACELSCDAEIVQGTDDDTRQQYSEAIIGVVRYQSRFKTALSITFYGGKKGMKNRITSIMTTSKKKATIGSVALAFVLVSILVVGTLMTFGAERLHIDQGTHLDFTYTNCEAYCEWQSDLPCRFEGRFAEWSSVLRQIRADRVIEELEMRGFRGVMILEELQELDFDMELIPTNCRRRNGELVFRINN